MPTAWHRRLRHTRRVLGYGLLVALVLVALAVAALSRAMPWLEAHPREVAAWLSERAGQPVTFNRLQASWTRRGPLLHLAGLRVGRGDAAIPIGDADLLVAIYRGWWPGEPLTVLRMSGLDLTLRRDDDGRWHVLGLPGQQTDNPDPLGSLQGLGELQLSAARLRVQVPARALDVVFARTDARLRVDGDRVRAGARVWRLAGRSPVELVFDLDRRRGDGRGFARARDADLAAWSPLLSGFGARVVGGRGEAEAWVGMQGFRVTRADADARFDGLRLLGKRDAGAAAPLLELGQLDARLRWRLLAGGWRLDAPRLRLRDAAREQDLDGLLVAGGARRALAAARVDAGPLLQIAALGDVLPPGLRAWLRHARPEAQLQALEIVGDAAGRWRVQARVLSAGFAPVGDAPGLAGVQGEVFGDGTALMFTPDPRAAFTFDWPRGFGMAHRVLARGDVLLWRDDDNARWEMKTPDLRVRVDGSASDPGIQAVASGGIGFSTLGKQPRMDLAAGLLAPARISAAHGFWVHHLMPQDAVDWLDGALQGGQVASAEALVAGNLEHWPLRDATGLFRIAAHIRGGVVRFQPEWPPVSGLEADVRFIADGFAVNGSGRLLGVPIRQVSAGIARFGSAPLTVQADGAADAAQLLELLRQSPLQREHADTLAQLQAHGPARVDFSLLLPLGVKGVADQVAGNVDLQGVALRDPRWPLPLQDVQGRVRYANGGFTGDALRLIAAGQPGTLAVRAGDFVRDPRDGFEADFGATLPASTLLAEAPALAWLQPRVRGSSRWQVGLSVPRMISAAAAAPMQVVLQSDLVGTTLDLPAPLDKPAALAQPVRISTRVPLATGDVGVQLPGLLALSAGSRAGGSAVRVQLGDGSVLPAVPPVAGLEVGGQVARLDPLGWAGVTGSGDGGGDGSDPGLRQLDIGVSALRLFGADFPATRLQASASANALEVRVQGADLAGVLQLPRNAGATVSGRFERVYWRGVTAAPAATPASADGAVAARAAALGATPVATSTATSTATTTATVTDPSRLPPLAMQVTDLRVNGVPFGAASLSTRPIAGGMAIEQVRTQGVQKLEASGSWLGSGANARTRLDLDIGSGDFGNLLGAFGMAGSIGGGHGKASFHGEWPGSPGDFSLARLDGQLHVAMQDGQLLEVNPGAGRVLGLLSLTQLPRRLILDFRDFFDKGFRFNRISADLRVRDGSASSDNLVIEGPAAEIRIQGSADLVAERFDETVEVLPRAGNLLTAVGAIAGGPIGAAVGAAANVVLQKPLGQLAARSYRVTGPWANPQVEPISRGQPRGQPREQARNAAPSASPAPAQD